MATDRRPVEGPHGRRVQHRDIEVGGGLVHRVEHGSDGDHGRVAPASLDGHAARDGRPRELIGAIGQPEIGPLVRDRRVTEQRLDLIGMPGDVYVPPGERGDERDILRRLMRPPARRGVVGRPDAHEHRPEVLMTEVELQHLERALDQERRVRVHDRPETREGEAARHTNHELFADPDVHVAVALSRPRGRELR